jgi:5-methylcytosine-specific restriction endonuclease McrA
MNKPIQFSKQIQDRAWWDKYNAHLASRKWQQLGHLVLHRENGLCQGCRAAAATEIHHLTYDRLGDELLIDLVAFCKPCHQRAHPLKRLWAIRGSGREREPGEE